MENTTPVSGQDQQQVQAPLPEQKKKKADEFSLEWHLKTLAVIYVVLGIFYLILKVTLK